MAISGSYLGARCVDQLAYPGQCKNGRIVMQAQLRRAFFWPYHMDIGDSWSPTQSLLQALYTRVILIFDIWKD